MSVRKIPKNRITKDGRSYAFIVTEYGLDGKRHQHQSKAYMTYEEAVQAEKDYINKLFKWYLKYKFFRYYTLSFME